MSTTPKAFHTYLPTVEHLANNPHLWTACPLYLIYTRHNDCDIYVDSQGLLKRIVSNVYTVRTVESFLNE